MLMKKTSFEISTPDIFNLLVHPFVFEKKMKDKQNDENRKTLEKHLFSKEFSSKVLEKY